MHICLIYLLRPDAANMKDLVGRKRFPDRIPFMGEEVEIATQCYKVVRIVHTPEDKSTVAAKLYVERSSHG